MRLLRFFLLSLILFWSAFEVGAFSVRISPGELSGVVGDEANLSQQLTITGSMDKRDFDTLADRFPALRSLDLSGVSIAAYTPYRVSGTMQAYFEADALPAGALLSKGLTSIKLPAGLKKIGRAALAGNNFEAIEIPASVTDIEATALYDCKQLKSIELPATVTHMEDMVLAGCDALTEARVLTTSLPAGTFLRCVALKQVTLPASLTEIGAEAFAGCSALESIELPSSLRLIGEKAFLLSGLKGIDVPASVSRVGEYSFALCPGLEKASFAGRPEVGDGAFFYSPVLTAVTFTATGGEPITFPDYLFAGSAKLNLPAGLNNVSSLGRYALKDNAMSYLNLGSKLEYLGDGAMQNMTSLKTIDAQGLGTRVPALGEAVFAGIDTKNVELVTAADVPTEPWETADQWKEFKISPVTGISTPGAPEAGIKAYMEGNELHVTAAVSIEKLRVYNPAGQLLLTSSPAALEATADLAGFDEKVFIVVVSTPGATATFKLTR